MDISAYQQMNIRMSTRGKRPLRNLTPGDKVRAIQRIHNGETKASVSRDIGVPESTLRGWCKNEQKLRFMCRQLGGDHVGIGMTELDNPPEKRLKFDGQLMPPKFEALPQCDELAYNHLPLHSIDLTANSNAMLEQIALVEFIKQKELQTKTTLKLISEKSTLKFDEAIPASSEFPRKSSVHHLNLFSLMNPKLAQFSNGGHLADMDDSKSEFSAHTFREMLHDDTAHSFVKSNSLSLSVKNWAKDPAKCIMADQNNEKNNENDSNNNDIIMTKQLNAPLRFSEAELLAPIVPANLTQNDVAGTPSTLDSFNTNIALFDWCKIFNASVSFLALAAAAAAIKPTMTTLAPKSEETIEQSLNVHSRILIQQLNTNLESGMNSLSHSDLSNESYFDSEPEDLSVRSIASKISSPSNSRSQSPTKSSFSSSLLSDGEQ